MDEAIKLFDVVVVNEPVPKERLRRGNIGTVVEILSPDVFIVEFADENGRTYALACLKTQQLIKVIHEPSAI